MAVSNRRKIWVAFLVLFLPSVAYLVLYSGKNNFRHLEIYGPKEVSAAGDTLYHTITPFKLTNQLGKPVTDQDLDGKIYVANFFFVKCPEICPKMNTQLKRVADKFFGRSEVMFVSHTVNPEQDSVPVLFDYATKYGANHNQWWFLTGDKESIYELARTGYMVAAAEGKGKDDFFHTEQMILVDKEKRIRGFYDGLDPNEVDTLIDEITVLLHEYSEKK